MKAIVQDKYGSAEVLELTDIDTPVVGDDDVLLRVLAASAHIGDWHIMTGLPYLGRVAFGLRAPRLASGAPISQVASRRSGRMSRGSSRAMRCSAPATAHSPNT